MQYSHLVVTPPLREPLSDTFTYGWHRDGGAINRDVTLHTPLLVKVGFYLSDVTPHGDPTLMLEDADPNAPIPSPTARPPNVRALAVKAGTAVLFCRDSRSLRLAGAHRSCAGRMIGSSPSQGGQPDPPRIDR